MKIKSKSFRQTLAIGVSIPTIFFLALALSNVQINIFGFEMRSLVEEYYPVFIVVTNLMPIFAGVFYVHLLKKEQPEDKNFSFSQGFKDGAIVGCINQLLTGSIIMLMVSTYVISNLPSAANSLLGVIGGVLAFAVVGAILSGICGGLYAAITNR